MTQNMIVICHKCKIGKSIGSFSNQFINIDEAYNFFIEHKGHKIEVIGDDGGWEAYIGKLIERGYNISW